VQFDAVVCRYFLDKTNFWQIEFNKKLLDFVSRCGLLNNREIRKIVEPRE